NGQHGRLARLPGHGGRGSRARRCTPVPRRLRREQCLHADPSTAAYGRARCHAAAMSAAMAAARPLVVVPLALVRPVSFAMWIISASRYRPSAWPRAVNVISSTP
ncbi:MAG: hypothetical protein QGI45_06815, partial [Myxococcota bacterium]|nr:hypothetical protein [Myxococcota bacterium]